MQNHLNCNVALYNDNINTQDFYGVKILRQSEFSGASNKIIWQSQLRFKFLVVNMWMKMIGRYRG